MSEKHDFFDLESISGRVATTCHEQDLPTYSKLLGPNGMPLPYKKNPVGFDLILKGRK
jgi:hypothetical protein